MLGLGLIGFCGLVNPGRTSCLLTTCNDHHNKPATSLLKIFLACIYGMETMTSAQSMTAGQK